MSEAYDGEGYCERRCFFRSGRFKYGYFPGQDEDGDEGFIALGYTANIFNLIKRDYLANQAEFSRFNNYGFDVPRLDCDTLKKRMEEIEFMKAFKEAIGIVNKSTATKYLPAGVSTQCTESCSRDQCECEMRNQPRIDDTYRDIDQFEVIFGRHFILTQVGYVLSTCILTDDGEYGWVVDPQDLVEMRKSKVEPAITKKFYPGSVVQVLRFDPGSFVKFIKCKKIVV